MNLICTSPCVVAGSCRIINSLPGVIFHHFRWTVTLFDPGVRLHRQGVPVQLTSIFLCKQVIFAHTFIRLYVTGVYLVACLYSGNLIQGTAT